ncbi:MAG TPA: hypothetical protein VK184_09820 [Nostocaceae cyanobacterium]|nr:hypothetical protein [Nostocaceae cyanobacterium]
MNQSTLNRYLTQIFGVLLGMGIALWILRGFGILTFLPGGLILLLFGGAIALAVLGYIQRRWGRI